MDKVLNQKLQASQKIARGLVNSSGVVASNQQRATQLANKLARCMIAPYDNATRLPSSYANESALFCTRQIFDIKVPTVAENAEGAGHFAFFVQPKIGDPSDPTSFKIGVVDFFNGIPTDLTANSSYVQGTDPADTLEMDQNSQILTMQSHKVFGLTHLPAVTDLRYPLDGFVQMQTVDSKGATVNVQYGMTVEYSGNVASTDTATFPKGGYSLLSLPPGSYSITVNADYTTAPTTGINALDMAVITARGGVIVKDRERIIYSNRNQLTAGPPPTYTVASSYGISLFDGDSLAFFVKDGPTAVSNIRVVFQTMVEPNLAWNTSNGVTEAIRPVGLSVLTTCRASDLTNGGDLISLYTTRDFADKVFTKEPRSWITPEGLTVYKKANRTTVKSGSYVWWSPSCQEDSFFRSVADHNAYEFPMILICGNADPTSGTPLSVVVDFVYEVQTQSQIFECKSETGDTWVIDKAMQMVGEIKHCSENKKHTTMLGDLAKVISASAPFIPFLASIF